MATARLQEGTGVRMIPGAAAGVGGTGSLSTLLIRQSRCAYLRAPQATDGLAATRTAVIFAGPSRVAATITPPMLRDRVAKPTVVEAAFLRWPRNDRHDPTSARGRHQADPADYPTLLTRLNLPSAQFRDAVTDEVHCRCPFLRPGPGAGEALFGDEPPHSTG